MAGYGLISTLFIGALAGWLAGKLTKGKGFGIIVNIILGICGAVLAGIVGDQIGIHFWGFWGNLTKALLGALTLLAVGNILRGKR
jgi:uncharacterized membrane protein YeaQ/YmgE (transglycosylase-associated protein family)